MEPNLYPSAGLDAYERSQMALVRRARLTLLGLAGMNLCAAVSIPVLVSLPVLGGEASGGAMSLVGGICVAAAVVGFSVVPMFVAAAGLRRGATWGWFGTVAIGGLYTPTLCIPVGLFLLYAMLNTEVRRSFLDPPKALAGY